MFSKPEASQAILGLIVENVPRHTWLDVQRAAEWAYQEAWVSTRDDPRFANTPGQRRFRAPQERHFLMEGGLAKVAVENKLSFASEVVKTNTWVYGMLRTASVCIMQKKVRDREEPPPANFRRQIAGANAFVRQGDLLTLGDKHVVSRHPVFGILIHGPESQRFLNDGYGRPAFIRLAFAFADYTGWAASFSIKDLIEAYAKKEETPKPERAKPSPTWKAPDEKTKKDRTSGE